MAQFELELSYLILRPALAREAMDLQDTPCCTVLQYATVQCLYIGGEWRCLATPLPPALVSVLGPTREADQPHLICCNEAKKYINPPHLVLFTFAFPNLKFVIQLLFIDIHLSSATNDQSLSNVT